MSFKVGDHVRVKQQDVNRYTYTQPGSEGIVIELLTSVEPRVRVKFSKMTGVQPSSEYQWTWPITTSDLELIEPMEPKSQWRRIEL